MIQHSLMEAFRQTSVLLRTQSWTFLSKGWLGLCFCLKASLWVCQVDWCLFWVWTGLTVSLCGARPPSLFPSHFPGHVCFLHPRNYRFNWHSVKIRRIFQKWARTKVKRKWKIRNNDEERPETDFRFINKLDFIACPPSNLTSKNSTL